MEKKEAGRISKNLVFLLIVIIMVVVVLIISACSQEAECKEDSDCTVAGTCEKPVCIQRTCQTQAKENCCGNANCEESAKENKCTCPEDCAVCEGDVEFITSWGDPQKAKYFNYGCIKNQCGIKYDTSKIDPRQAYHELSADYITIGLLVEYIQPFEINYGKIKIEYTLKDYMSDVMRLPLEIKEIRIMEDTLLLGRKTNIGYELEEIGDTYNIEIPISYSMSLPEEQKSISIHIDYQYMKVIEMMETDDDGNALYDEDGQIIYKYVDDEIKIGTSSQYITESIYFIDPNYDEVKVDFSQD